MSIYDLTRRQFLRQLIPLKGCFPGRLFANDDVSKIWAPKGRSDDITVIDTRTKTVEKVIDIHACNPSPDSLEFPSEGPTTQRVAVSSLKSTGACTASTSAGWLSAAGAGEAVSQALDITVDPSVFGPGTYRGTVTLRSASLAESTLTVGLKVGSGLSSVQIAGIVDGAGFEPVIAPGAWASVTGSNLAPATRIWRPEEIVEGLLPTCVEGVGAMVNGRDASVHYVSPRQINFQVPDGLADGQVQVQLTNNGALSNVLSVSLRQRAPELFRFLPSAYVVALHTNYRIAAKPDLFPECRDPVLCPPAEAAPGQTILLYGTGFGPTAPPAPVGRVISVPTPTASPVRVRFGEITVEAPAWLVSAGLYQINVRVPDSLPDGDVPVAVLVAGSASSSKGRLTVSRPR